MTFDLGFQKSVLSKTRSVLMQKIRAMGQTVFAGEAVKDRHIRKQYIWILSVELIELKHFFSEVSKGFECLTNLTFFKVG